MGAAENQIDLTLDKRAPSGRSQRVGLERDHPGAEAETRAGQFVDPPRQVGLVARHAEVQEQRAYRRQVGQVIVKAPDGLPAMSQESVDLALVMFGIELPTTAEHPAFDPNLRDRGLTTRGAFMDKAQVTVGPAAFSSWSLLGSTLAHEIEVHCQQNFLAIYLMDAVGLDGTGAAERQAYIHELKGAKRFGLVSEDSELIADTMEYYYPEKTGQAKVGVPSVVRNWLARNFLRADRTF